MAPTRSRSALVLGGGGITGIAWEIGLLKGLRDRGVDLTTADRVIGTSAGSVVGARITSALDLDEMYAEQLQPADSEIGADYGWRQMLGLGVRLVLPASGRGRRRRLGRAARRAHPEPATERLRVFESRLRGPDGTPLSWSDRDLRITAIDADSGSFTVFDRDSGVDLLHAVAASCAVPLVWPAVEIDGHHYIDGGMRSAANADLAAGHDPVVAIVPLTRSVSRYHALPQQLRRTGAARAVWVAPDRDALAAIGRNVLDPAKRMDAARAGARQAAVEAHRVAEAWAVSAP
jgi:NTE family protein